MELISISGKDIEVSWDSSHPSVIWGQALECSLAKDLLDGWTPVMKLREGQMHLFSHVEQQLWQDGFAQEAE